MTPQLLALFGRELSDLETELAHAVAGADLPRVRRRAHYLRNSALAVQAHELLEISTRLEDAAARDDLIATRDTWTACASAIGRRLAVPHSS